MKLKFLGTGGSQGVPYIGCTHPVCLSADPKDRRLRSSALITTDCGQKILIDCGPDFRQQMLANGEDQVDAVLLTHEHNDHVIGLDDLRPVIFKNKKPMPLYCSGKVAGEIKTRFAYAFGGTKAGVPSFQIHDIKGVIQLFGKEIFPVKIWHGQDEILGFRIGKLAYITDASAIPEESLPQLQGLDTLIINCLRRTEPHPLHFILPEVLAIIDVLKPKSVFLTHITHNLGFHAELLNELPPHVRPAYDGLEINFN